MSQESSFADLMSRSRQGDDVAEPLQQRIKEYTLALRVRRAQWLTTLAPRAVPSGV